MKATDLLVQALENEGVEYIFTVPGEETLDLMESIRTSKIALLVLRHEQVAGFMAATYGRLKGKAGVCLTTLGPGATNLMTAVAHAQLGSMPMVVITGQKSIKKHVEGKFQIVDVVTMMRPLTKATQTIVNVRNIPSLIRESFHLATAETPGVVHLELPEDIAQESCQGLEPFPVTTHYPPHASDANLEAAIAMIEKAKYPLLMIGAGANRKRISRALKQFVTKVPMPFFTTQMGKGVIDESNTLHLGTAAISKGDFVHAAIEHADLIINIGHDIVEKPPFRMRKKGANVIHINAHPAQFDDTYFPQLEVIGEIAHTIDVLRKRLSLRAHCDLSHYYTIRKARQAHIKALAADDTFPIRLPRLVQEVQNVMPKEGILAFDNGLYKLWFARNYVAHHPNTVLLDNALATMGAGVSVAMGAKLIYPDHKVVAVCGDGGFLMNSNALESALRLGLDLVILLLRDNAYGMIRWKQAEMDLPDYGLTFTNPDFVKYAEAYGAFGQRIMTIEEIGPALSGCMKKEGVHLLEVHIDYSKSNDRLGKELAQYTAGIWKKVK